MTQRFYHGPDCNNAFINFNGQQVLYTLNIESDPARRCVVVAGYVVGEPRKEVPGEKCRVTDVSPITRPDERKGLSDLLREKEKRDIIDFWNDSSSN